MVSGDVQIAVLVQKFVFFFQSPNPGSGAGSVLAGPPMLKLEPDPATRLVFTVVPYRLLQHADAATCPAGMLLV